MAMATAATERKSNMLYEKEGAVCDSAFYAQFVVAVEAGNVHLLGNFIDGIELQFGEGVGITVVKQRLMGSVEAGAGDRGNAHAVAHHFGESPYLFLEGTTCRIKCFRVSWRAAASPPMFRTI